ncbi:MAG: hypothetical protein IJ532_09015 [Alphaproteobacteria bacterium]|nr:hypothetical protein [Alphaproteobacteria bacterium]
MSELAQLTGGLCFFLGAIIGCMIVNFLVKKLYKGDLSYCISFVIICLICGFSMGNGDYLYGVSQGILSYILPIIALYFIDKQREKLAQKKK